MGKNLWRTVPEVKKGCKAAQARLCQLETEAQARLCQPETENEGSAVIYQCSSSSCGELGGAPKAKKTDKGKDVEKMDKAELMVYAKDVLGVETRRVGADGKKSVANSAGGQERLQGGAGQVLPAFARESGVRGE